MFSYKLEDFFRYLNVQRVNCWKLDVELTEFIGTVHWVIDLVSVDYVVCFASYRDPLAMIERHLLNRSGWSSMGVMEKVVVNVEDKAH
jgi:hypothetical protein